MAASPQLRGFLRLNLGAAAGVGKTYLMLGDARLAAEEGADLVIGYLEPAAEVPGDLVTASASGLDPDVSLQGALIQVNRVARARGLAPARVEQLLRGHVQDTTLGFLGAKRVNVLSLNIALTELRSQ